MSLAKRSLKATHVAGDTHSTLVGQLHSKLAAKHGMEYVAIPNYPSKLFRNKEAWESKQVGPYDDKLGSYEYLLKASLEDIERPDTLTTPVAPSMWRNHIDKEYDYSHVLPEVMGADGKPETGNRLIVARNRPTGDGKYTLTAKLYHRGVLSGGVDGIVRPADLSLYTADARLREDRRGKKLGTALYEALYAHAVNDAKIKTVVGHGHSDAARRVHQKLATKYGFNYQTTRNIIGLKNATDGAFENRHEWTQEADRDYNNRWGKYKYRVAPKTNAIE
jgi:GNAT superfamily N-acetyltransferase